MDKLSHRKLDLRDIILGGQDGLVNVLGVTLGIAAASGDTRFVLAAGLAATFAESFSMAAVAYTSSLDGSRAILDALIVGFSAILGSLIPLAPFVFLPIPAGIKVSLIVSASCLFLLGVYKSKVTAVPFWRGGIQIALIGIAAASAGYLVGLLFRVPAS